MSTLRRMLRWPAALVVPVIMCLAANASAQGQYQLSPKITQTVDQYVDTTGATQYTNISSYGYEIGRWNGSAPNSSSDIYRTAFSFDLSPVGIAVSQIKSISLYVGIPAAVATGNFTANVVSLSSSENLGDYKKLWGDVGSSTTTLLSNLKYNNDVTQSSTNLTDAVETALQSSTKVLNIGVFCNQEGTNQDAVGGVDVVLYINYTPQITVENTFPDGTHGGQIEYNGTTETSPYTTTLSGTATIAAFSSQTENGTTYLWKNWSDKGAISHSITPTSDKTYQAFFVPQATLSLTTPNYIDAGGSGATYDINGVQENSITLAQGDSATIQANAPTGWAFAGWSNGDFQNPTSVSVNSNTSINASFKELQHSMDASAYSDNSQRKMIQTPNGYLFETYTDSGHVWVEYSSNQGSSWTLANNGEPLDYDFVTQSNPDSKCPSLDYDPSNNDVIVVFEEQNGKYYNIDYDVFAPSGSSYINLFDQQPATVYQETSDAYSVNANPDFAVYDGYWVIAFEQKTATGNQSAGINYLFGTFDSFEMLQAHGPFSMWETNSSSTLPSIYGAKSQSNWYTDIAWQQGSGTSSTIEFAELAFNSGTMDTLGQTTPIIISNSAWPANYQPSLVQEPNSTAWVC